MSYGRNLGWGRPTEDYIGFWGGPMKGYITNLVQGSSDFEARFHLRLQVVDESFWLMPCSLV